MDSIDGAKSELEGKLKAAQNLNLTNSQVPVSPSLSSSSNLQTNKSDGSPNLDVQTKEIRNRLS